MQDALGTTSYEYDEVYRVKSVTDPHGFTIGYEYDEAGNIAKLTYPDGKAVEYNYDRSGLLEEAIPWFASAQTATFRHDILDNLGNAYNFNTSYSGFNFDRASRLTSIYHNKMIRQAKALSKATRSVSPQSLFIGNATIAAYSYTLDGNGNRLKTEQAEPLAPVVTSEDSAYTYNDKRNRLLSAGDDTFGYDDEGQQSDKNETTYTFDDAHRLVGIEGGQSVQYYYDGAGRRLKAVRNGIETRYIYDAGGNFLAEADADNNILKYYIYGESLLAMVTPDDEYYSYHFDGNGNTVAITDKNQRVVNAYTYEPFGTITNQRELLEQPFKFAGQYGIMHEDSIGSDAGLYYMRARYYDPEVGRFISEDPSGFSDGPNLYAYVGNNPVNHVDPLGLYSYLPQGASPMMPIVSPIPMVNPIVVNSPVDLVSNAKASDKGSKKESGDSSSGSSGGGNNNWFSENVKALIELAKEAFRRGVSPKDAKTLIEWAKELGVRSRGPESHPNRPYGRSQHIHIGPINHIPIR